MPDLTVRYEAASRISYSMALLALAEYARGHEVHFSVYPATLDLMETAGLSVSGPDLAGVRAELGKIPGLVEQ